MSEIVFLVEETPEGGLTARAMGESINIRDLRNKTGELVRLAESGQLSLVTKHGNPVFVTVPFDGAC